MIANVGNGSAGRRMRTVLGGSGSGNDRDSDHDDLDYDEEFADDEEAPIMDGDEEENKLSEKNQKEMLKAAHFDGQLEAEQKMIWMICLKLKRPEKSIKKVRS